METIEHLNELLELQMYYNNTNIVFNILIPHISLEQYTISHTILIPINKIKELIIKPYTIYNKKKSQYFNNLCKRIENTFYCKDRLQ